MNREETIYSAVSEIRSEYIEQAADYRFSRKRSFLRIGSAVAAACVVLCAGALGIRYMLLEGRKGADLASGAQPAALAYEETAEADLSAAGPMAVAEERKTLVAVETEMLVERVSPMVTEGMERQGAKAGGMGGSGAGRTSTVKSLVSAP